MISVVCKSLPYVLLSEARHMNVLCTLDLPSGDPPEGEVCLHGCPHRLREMRCRPSPHQNSSLCVLVQLLILHKTNLRLPHCLRNNPRSYLWDKSSCPHSSQQYWVNYYLSHLIHPSDHLQLQSLVMVTLVNRKPRLVRVLPVSPVQTVLAGNWVQNCKEQSGINRQAGTVCHDKCHVRESAEWSQSGLSPYSHITLIPGGILKTITITALRRFRLYQVYLCQSV